MAIAYDTCRECGLQTIRPKGRGTWARYCSEPCREAAAVTRAAQRRKHLAQCSIDGCESAATRVGAQLCEKHYARERRHGHYEYVGNVRPGEIQHSGGYVLIAAPGHPMAKGGYRAYEHRVVFYNAYGEGPFECHWCGCAVTWVDMHIDHVDGDKKNNNLDNLVSSCALCNQARGKEKMRRTLRERYGLELDGEVKTLAEWAEVAGISRNALIERLKKGWSLRRAVYEPRGRFGPKPRRAVR